MEGRARRRIPKPLILIGLLAAGLVAGVAIAYAVKTSTLLGGALALGFMAATFAVTARHWRGLDEVSREAHKVAWYWGAPIAIALAASAIVVVPDPAAVLGPQLETDDAFLMGFMFCVLSQMVGYLVTWVGWWLSKGLGREG